MNRLDTSSTSDSFVPEDGTASSRCSFGGISSIVLLHIASFCRKPVISLFQGFRSVSEVVAAHYDVHRENAPAIVNVYFVVHLLK